MEGLPLEICHKIFCLFDYQSLATAHQVCRKWKLLGSDDNLWLKLYKARWGEDREGLSGSSKSWKYAYEVQDRCYRIGEGLTVIREGDAYYLVHQGEIRRYLGSKRERPEEASSRGEKEEKSCRGILDNIIFFVGDLEVASYNAKRSRWI